jgi:hypothetical protein
MVLELREHNVLEICRSVNYVKPYVLIYLVTYLFRTSVLDSY